jgi:hypothetical protein
MHRNHQEWDEDAEDDSEDEMEQQISEREAIELIIQKYPSMNGVTTNMVKREIYNTLNELGLFRAQIRLYMEKTQNYRIVDNSIDIRPGSFIRWISLNDMNVKLQSGSIIHNIIEYENDVQIVHRNIKGSKMFTLFLSENIIFQKLNDEEEIVLYAMDNGL